MDKLTLSAMVMAAMAGMQAVWLMFAFYKQALDGMKAFRVAWRRGWTWIKAKCTKKPPQVLRFPDGTTVVMK